MQFVPIAHSTIDDGGHHRQRSHSLSRARDPYETRSYARCEGPSLIGRVHILECQFNDADAAIVGIQEGRSRASQTRESVYYNMYVASADAAGSYGVQIWVKHACKFKLHT